MKTVNTIILILTTSFVFGQAGNTVSNEFQNFSRQDFIDNNLTKVTAYSYFFNEKGEVKKDSLLLYKQQFDINQNRIFGLKSNRVYQSYGPSYLTWYEFETYYNDSGQVIKEIRNPKNIEKIVDSVKVKYNVIINETNYEYDELKREVKITYNQIDHHYLIFKNTLDTLHFANIIRPIIDEYVYNSDNQKTQWFHTVDSTRNLKTESYNPDKDSNSVRCSYCDSRYLNVVWKYNSDKKLTELISYTSENLIHDKQNYFYDDQQRLIRQIDSSGWYFATIKPYWESTTTFQYSNTRRIVTKINNSKVWYVNSVLKIVSEFDSDDNLIKECSYSDSTKNCTQYSFVYDNNKIIRKEIVFDNGTISSTEFHYNNKGVLTEERTLRNSNLSSLIRYYYD
jgi:hypothetical protein